MQNWVRFVILMRDSDTSAAGEGLAIALRRPIHVVSQTRGSLVDSMGPLPETCRNRQRIDCLLFPPDPFIAAPVEFAVVKLTNRNGKPVAGLIVSVTIGSPVPGLDLGGMLWIARPE
jgi:hypothetical protein